MGKQESFEEKILRLLVEKFRRSKKDSGTNVINRSTKIRPKDVYPKYEDSDGDLESIQELNEAARICKDRGFLDYKQKGFSYEIADLILNDRAVIEIEDFLFEQFGYESRDRMVRRFRELIEKYQGRSGLSDFYCHSVEKLLDNKKYPKDIIETEDILKALVFLGENKQTLFLREASVLIYGTSKYFEDNTLDAVCGIIRKFLKENIPEKEGRQLIELYGILISPQKLCLKGDCVIRTGECALDLSSLAEGIEFQSSDLKRIDNVTINAPLLITVENRTSYDRMSADSDVYCLDSRGTFMCNEISSDSAYINDVSQYNADCDTLHSHKAVIFYLGGYVNRYQRDFLKIIKRCNPDLGFAHFGDIDSGGLYIHEDLCKKTGIDFSMMLMSEEQLSDVRFKDYCQPLTENDRRRLESLRKNDCYRQIAEYMLKNNVKLEQEIISYETMTSCSFCSCRHYK